MAQFLWVILKTDVKNRSREVLSQSYYYDKEDAEKDAEYFRNNKTKWKCPILNRKYEYEVLEIRPHDYNDRSG